MHASVSIVIVGFEDPASLRMCIDSIREGTYSDYRILLIDNSPSETLKREFSREPDVEYLRTGTNLGFSRGCNVGIARSLAEGSQYTLLLNPDTKLDAGCLEELVRTAQSNPDAGIVGGCIHYLANPGRIWYGGGKLDYFTGVGKHLAREMEVEVEATVTTGYVTGCCMLVPNALLRRIGGLKESIFMYLDDAEFCMRVLRSGSRLYYNPRARLSHKVGPGSDWRRYPDYYLYFSVRNRPLVASGHAYRVYLHVMALAVAAGKAAKYAVLPGVPDRLRKLRVLCWGATDSLSVRARERERFPELFASGSSGI